MDRRVKRLIATRRYRSVIDELRQCEPNPERAYFLASALVGHAGSLRDDAAQKRYYKEAYELLLPLLYEDEPPTARGTLLRLLQEAARVVDPDLAAILADRSFTAGRTSPAHNVLKSYYLGGAMSRPGSVGDRVLKRKRELKDAVCGGGSILPSDWYIQFLKTYSSYTPLMPSSWGEDTGGGYFLALGGHGCVIDPGHHFLDNFFRAFHEVDDIDSVVVTHHHDDHFADLAPLLSLLYHHCAATEKRIQLFLDGQTSAAFDSLIRRSMFIKRREILTSRSTKVLDLCEGVSLKALPTKHDVHGSNSGVGLCIDVTARHVRLIISGDTAWERRIARRYANLRHERCVLVAHISTASHSELVSAITRGRTEYHAKHLGIHGLCKAIETLRPFKVILSEIGEELDVGKGSLDYLCQLIAEYYEVDCSVGTQRRFGGKIHLK